MNNTNIYCQKKTSLNNALHAYTTTFVKNYYLKIIRHTIAFIFESIKVHRLSIRYNTNQFFFLKLPLGI